jgi:hypothetical protein
MTARRLFSVLSVGLSAGLVVSATVVAQPTTTPPATQGTAKKKTAPRKGRKAKPAPAPDAGAAAGTGSAAGSAVQMAEDPPPADPSGTAENPDSPRTVDAEAPAVAAVVAPAPPRTGYPVEEVLRPITLPQNLAEVSIMPHAVVSPYASSMALRARYGITRDIQLGLTYQLGGIFDDPSTVESRQAFHSGKAVGVDVTVMLLPWLGVTAGVPIYISPVAASLTLGAPVKFTITDQFAIGGLDDLLDIRLSRFAPTFYSELQNATNAADTMTNTIKSSGELRVSGYGIYQYQRDFAIIGRIGIQLEDFATGKSNGCLDECATTFLSAGFHYAPRRYLDLGLQIGFDDLAHGGSFAPAGFLAFRI